VQGHALRSGQTRMDARAGHLAEWFEVSMDRCLRRRFAGLALRRIGRAPLPRRRGMGRCGSQPSAGTPSTRALHRRQCLAAAGRREPRVPTPRAGWLQRAGAKAFGAALPIVQPLLLRPGAAGRIAFGLLWGFLPCGLVYSVLPLALFAGGAWQGGAVMLAFALGTLPNLMAAGAVLRRAKRAFDGFGAALCGRHGADRLRPHRHLARSV
jgi:hypothetical protein